MRDSTATLEFVVSPEDRARAAAARKVIEDMSLPVAVRAA